MEPYKLIQDEIIIRNYSKKVNIPCTLHVYTLCVLVQFEHANLLNKADFLMRKMASHL